MKVLHLAYLHRKNDIRIVQKECTSLVQSGYEVFYATADNGEISKEDAMCGIKFIPLQGTNDSLLVNYFINKNLRQEYIDIIERVQPQIVHIHEYGISYLVRFIKKRYKNIKVIYDVHEDNANVSYEQDVKKYGNTMATLLVWLRMFKEHQACRYADVVITATPHIEELLSKYCKMIETIKNYPIVNSAYMNRKRGGGYVMQAA